MKLALALASPLAAPQAPIAAGSFESIVEVIGAARTCAVQNLRIALYPTDTAGEARLYLLEDSQSPHVRCLHSWLTANGRRLRLVPRWENDDFTRDMRR